MTDVLIVSLAVTAGVVALAGVPMRCWQFYTGQFRSQIPRNAVARATFSLFAAVFLIPNLVAWAYALHVAYQDLAGAGAQAGVASAVAVGMLGCVYVLLEGFLVTARRTDQPGNALSNSAAKRE